jgi:uncharacterized membrane protein YbhN (UPF0104 family)
VSAIPDAGAPAPGEASSEGALDSVAAPDSVAPTAPSDGRWALVWRLVLGVVTVVGVVLLARRLGAADLGTRLQSARLGWVAVAAGLSVLPVLGSTLTLVALTPGRLPFGRTASVQLATSFVNLVTPASAGGLALNVRYLNRRRVPTASAVAVVGIVQVTAVLVTAVLVLGLLPIAGRDVNLPGMPRRVLIVVAVLVGLVGAVLRCWAPAGAWAARNVLAPVRKTWPSLRATLADPVRGAAVVAGHLTVTLGFAGTLAACVAAFGGSGSLLLVTLVVVGSSAVAGAVPVPGGIGAAEAALTTGLVTVVGIDPATALSAALLYRLVTFWSRVPIGWIALIQLRRAGDV